MIRNSALFVVWLGIALTGFAQQPPTQPAQTPPATSPAIIAPPQGTPKPTDAQVPTPSNPDAAADKQEKPDPAPVDPKNGAAVGAAYVIGPEDILFIRVWRNADLTGTVTVGPDGMISLQLIDEVKASGYTALQLADVIAKRLKKFYTEPEVNVQVLAARSRTYILLGDGVIKPGIFPLPKPLTVLEALLAGGGFTPFANKKKIFIMRGTQKIPFNWNDVSRGRHPEQNILIQNGDRIFVP